MRGLASLRSAKCRAIVASCTALISYALDNAFEVRDPLLDALDSRGAYRTRGCSVIAVLSVLLGRLTILKLVTPKTKLVWLANPNNPTGTYLPFDEVRRLRAGLPPHVLLVLDAAYSDYVSRNDYEMGIELVATTDNTVLTHTFSKIHGLAALRIGWMFGPAHVVDAVNRIRGPFNVSTPAMRAAVAAIEDTAHIEMSKAHTEKWRSWLTEEIRKLGLTVTPSVANFVLIHFPAEKGKTAADADAFLTKRGLVLRALTNYKLPHALRLTIGTEEANRLVVEGLREFVAPK